MEKILKLIIIFICLTHLAFAQDVKEVQNDYPLFRQFRSGFNLTFGGATLVKALQVLDSDETNNTEKNIAYGLSLIGTMRLIDGFYYLYKESLPEVYLKEGKLNRNHKNFQANLNEARRFEKKLRRYRATVIFLNGIGLFALYDQDPERNKLSLYPGMGMMLVASYAFWGKGPSETAYDRLFPEFSIMPKVMRDKVVLAPTLNMSF